MSSLGKGLAEIDGILAGCEYLDLLDAAAPRGTSLPTLSDGSRAHIPAYQRQQTPDLTSFVSTTCSPTTLYPQPTSHSTPPRPENAPRAPTTAQWEALNTLRTSVTLQFGQFNALSAQGTLHSAVVDRLRDCYGDARGMRESGLLTYKDILQGMRPEDLRLEEILAFACLSYSLAKVLCLKGQLSETAILGGLPVWREAVTESEKPTFDYLARSLWPEAGQILDAVQRERNLEMAPVLAMCAHNANGTLLPEKLHMPDPLTNGLPTLFPELLAEGAGYTDVIDDWMMPQPMWEQAVELLTQSSTSLGFEGFLVTARAGGDFTSPDSLGLESVCPSLIDSPPSLMSPPPTDFYLDTHTPPPLLQRLMNTNMFKVVSLWFSHVPSLAEFLRTLSGDGLFSRKTGKRTGFAGARQLHQFQRIMLEQFFAPLDTHLPTMLTRILQLTKTLVLTGTISSLRDVEQHIFAITKAFGLNVDTQQKFLKVVLNRCLKISQLMTNCVYNSDSREPYSEQYIGAKLQACFGQCNSKNVADVVRVKRSLSHDEDGAAQPKDVAAPRPKKSTRVTCQICGKSYSGHSNLSRHKKHEHNQNAPPGFVCPYPGCNKICSRADNLRQHCELVHKKHEASSVQIPAAPAASAGSLCF